MNTRSQVRVHPAIRYHHQQIRKIQHQYFLLATAPVEISHPSLILILILRTTRFDQPTHRKCSSCVFNARSVVNKICELHYMLYSGNYEMLFVTETWLNDGVCNGILDPNSMYHVLRKDRPSCGGGVAAFVNRQLHIVEIPIATEFLIWNYYASSLCLRHIRCDFSMYIGHHAKILLQDIY